MAQGYQLYHLLSLRLLKPSCDNVLLEHGLLPHLLPIAVHLDFCAEQVEGVILSNFYTLSFLVREFSLFFLFLNIAISSIIAKQPPPPSKTREYIFVLYLI